MKRYALLFGAALAALFISGCKKDNVKPDDPATPREVMSAALVAGLIELAKQPLLDLECPAGCKVKLANPQAMTALSNAVSQSLAPVPEPLPWWAAPLNTGLQILGQVASIKYGLNGIANITGGITTGMLGLGQSGFGALERTAGAGFAAHSATTQAALVQLGLVKPSINVHVEGDANVGSAGATIMKPIEQYDFSGSGDTNFGGGTITKPAPRICTTNPTTGVVSCSPG